MPSVRAEGWCWTAAQALHLGQAAGHSLLPQHPCSWKRQMEMFFLFREVCWSSLMHVTRGVQICKVGLGISQLPQHIWGSKSGIRARNHDQMATELAAASLSPDIFYLQVSVVIWGPGHYCVIFLLGRMGKHHVPTYRTQGQACKWPVVFLDQTLSSCPHTHSFWADFIIYFLLSSSRVTNQQ